VDARRGELRTGQLLNNQVDAFVTGGFMLLVLLLVGSCGRVWWQLLARKTAPEFCEEPYTSLSPGAETVRAGELAS